MDVNMSYKYGPAEKKDCAALAEFINMASDGVVEYLFRDLVPGMTPVQLIAHNLENDDSPHSYKSAIVARDGDDVVGMALSYPSDDHYISDEMRSFFIQALWYAQGIRKYGFVKGAGASPIDEPKKIFGNISYITDGYRAVIWVSEEPIPLNEVDVVDWEIPPER